ncbi:MAG: SPOR domain-containing protein [Gammaproteobacteria bacterium]
MKPAQNNHLTGNQFFLIRQTANLMEDFVREIGNTSSLFLLYGEQSVGKSWLLRELTSKRFDHDNIHWIDFKADAAGAKSRITGSKPEQGRDAGEISKLMETAKDGELIIADHFELASNKARHALFQSWVTDGIDKKLNLIIAASTDSFNEVRQFAQQHQLEVKSFQLLPYNAAEIEAFLGFYLFPDNPLKPLLIPAGVSKQIKNCRGVIGEVAEVATQQENKITQNLKLETKSNSRIVVGIMLTLLLVAAVAYGFLKPEGQKEIVTAIEPEIVESISSNDVVESIVDSPENLEPVHKAVIAEPSETPQPAIPVEVESVNQLAPDTDAEPDQLYVSAKAEQPEQPALDTRIKGVEESLLESTGSYSLRFQQELGDTLSWIRQIDKNRSTIQIMSLGFGDSTDVTYHRYLEKLKKLDIDIAQIKIYPTRRNGSILFGVIYGEYDDRTEAVEQIRQLPEELKANRPIPRTMGGIWNDINR